MKYFTKTAIEHLEIKRSDPPDKKAQEAMRNIVADKPIKQMGILRFLKFQREYRKGFKNHKIIHE